MSAQRNGEGGVPRAMRRVATLPGRAGEKEQWLGANEAKVEKLRARSVQRRASAGGYQLRHSDYGYALFDTTRKSVNGRNDMSVKEIESWLDTALGR